MREIQLCRRLLQQADNLRFESPSEAVRVAQSARDRAASLRREDVGEPQWLALQADVWAVLGSTLRAISDPGEAEGALNVALAFLQAPQASVHSKTFTYARLAQRAAYVRCDQQRFDEALDLVDEAIRGFEAEGDLQAAAGALADRGLILGRAGCQEEAIVHIGEALDRLDPEESPHNFFAAIHNTAFYLHELADDSPSVDELAVKWLGLAYRCHRALPAEGLSFLKFRTLRALTAIRYGRVEEGVQELWQTHEAFERLGAVYEQSLTLLHLASTYLNEGRGEEVRRVASRLFPVLRGLKTDREASAAVKLFYNAAQAETATLELVDQVLATLRKAQARSL